MGGIPAKILKYRFSKETIQKLMELEWWSLNPKELDGIQFDDIQKAIKQLEKIKRKKVNPAMKKETITELQKSINDTMQKSQDSQPLMTFNVLKEIISSQLLEADIDYEVVEEILYKNKKMNRDYDEDEHADQVILNHKIAAVIEIVLADKDYAESQILSTQGHKKIMNVLRDKQ